MSITSARVTLVLAIFAGAAAMSLMIGGGSIASAAVMTATASSPSATGFDGSIAANDLINTGQATLSSATTTQSSMIAGYTFGGINDASAAANANKAFWGQNGNSSPAVSVFELNTTLNPLGYDITQIQSITGHTDQAHIFAHQNWSIEYSTVADPTLYLPLASVDYQPFAVNLDPGSTMVTLTDDMGILATGVARLRFNVPKFDGSNTAVYRELDIFGVPTPAAAPVPEPATIALWGMLGVVAVGLHVCRRRHR